LRKTLSSDRLPKFLVQLSAKPTTERRRKMAGTALEKFGLRRRTKLSYRRGSFNGDDGSERPRCTSLGVFVSKGGTSWGIT